MNSQPKVTDPAPEHTVEDLADLLILLGFEVQIWDDETQVAFEKNHGLTTNEGASHD